MRELYRSIAKARLREMGIRQINRRFSSGFSHTAERKLQRRYPWIWVNALKRRQKTELWRRTIWGDVARMYERGKRRQQKNRRILGHE